MDLTSVNPARDILMREDSNFRELVQQHQNYEKRLSELASLTYPNEEELLEEATLKKKKLAVKDEIYTLLQKHPETVSH
jgi:uncharacterized protein YdcH (DUF465 family)